MAERFKTVHVNSKVPVRGIANPFIGIRRNVKMSIEDIGICLARGASVIEVFEDGRMQKLTPKNYRDNFFAEKTEEMDAAVKEQANAGTVIVGGNAGGSSSNEEGSTPEDTTTDTPVEDIPVEETPVEGDKEVEETPVEGEETTEEETEETPVEDTPVEETPVEEETDVPEEEPVEEEVPEETPVEGEVVEETTEGENPVFDFATAYDNTEAGGTITLEGDVTLDDTFVIEKDITIDLNGYEIRSAKSVFEIKANVVIEGEGYVAGGEGGSYVCIKANTGTLTINGGHFFVGADENGEGNSTIYVNGDCIVHINDGYFETAAAYNNFWYVLNKKNGVAGAIVVNGGTFLSYNPAEGDDDASEDTFVAEGYEIVYDEEGDEYVVVESAEEVEETPVEGEETTEEAGAPAEDDAVVEETTEEVAEETTSNVPDVTLENVEEFTKAQLTVWAEANGVDISGMNKATMVETIKAALTAE